jgi:CheY-like chemotaxis protein
LNDCPASSGIHSIWAVSSTAPAIDEVDMATMMDTAVAYLKSQEPRTYLGQLDIRMPVLGGLTAIQPRRRPDALRQPAA